MRACRIIELLAELGRRDPDLAEAGREVLDARGRVHAVTRRAAGLEKKLNRTSHEREEYRKMYELAVLLLERLRGHLSGRQSERVSPTSSRCRSIRSRGCSVLPIWRPNTAESGPPSEHHEPAGERDRGGLCDGERRRERVLVDSRSHNLPVETIVLLPAELQGDERDDLECISEEVSETRASFDK